MSRRGRVDAGRVILESLRLDFDPEEAVREKAETALALGVGGFIVFGGERAQVARLVSDLRERVKRPLWIGADLERGAGQQFSGLPTLPPPAAIAAHRDAEDAARTAGAITARGAKRVGVDLVFAPVLDLDIEPDNPIVGTRSFGSDPVAVGALAHAWIDGCQGEGVVACAKHFPGHGRTTVDSHAEIPVVETPRGELEADIVPFRRVSGKVGAMLTAHVAYPALGVDGPATLSRELLTGLLREKIGFDGLIVTDAMNMSGFLDAAEAGEGEARPDARAAPAVAALLAGCDLLLYPDDLVAAIDAIEEAALDDPRVGERVREAVERSDRVRRRLLRPSGIVAGLSRVAGAPSEPSEPAESPGASGARSAPDPDALEAAAMGVGAIRRRGEMPEWMHAGRPIRVIAIWDDREMRGRSPFGARFADELRDAGWQPALADPADQPERIPSIVLIGSTPQAWKGTAGLTADGAAAVEHALSNPAGAYPVVFGHERLLKSLGDAGICAWGTEPTLELLAARRLIADAGPAGAASGSGPGPQA